MTSHVFDLSDQQSAASDAASSVRAVYTVAEVSELLNLALCGTYELVRSGKIPARKLGNRWVIPKSAFHDWLNTIAVEPSSGWS